MAQKHFLYVNEKGRKFKTTLSGKKQLELNRKLVSRTKLLGECNENGVLLSIVEPVTLAPKSMQKSIEDFNAEVEKKVQERLKEAMVKTAIEKEVKFVEPETEKRKYVKKN